MHRNFKDISGNRFGKLVVFKPVESNKRGIQYLCICDCGKEIIKSGRDIRSSHKGGNVVSCGCQKAISSALTGKNNKTHGFSQMNNQAKNTRRVQWIEFNGQKLSLSDWSRKTGISVRTLIKRKNRGWTPERMLTEVPMKGKNQFS